MMDQRESTRRTVDYKVDDNLITEEHTPPLVDLHCHVVPGVDDGARDDQHAVKMLRAAHEDGIQTIVATPHAGHTTREEIEQGVAHVNRLASDAEIDVEVLPGCEARIGADLVAQVRSGELLTINGTDYLLLELYLAHSWAMDTVELVVDRLHDAGIQPILAHVERYPTVQRNLDSIEGLLLRGVPMQVNAHSLTGYHGPDAQRVAEQLARDGNLHLLASDAHNAERRAPQLNAAFRRLIELAGDAVARQVRQNAIQVLRNESVPRRAAGAIR